MCVVRTLSKYLSTISRPQLAHVLFFPADCSEPAVEVGEQPDGVDAGLGEDPSSRSMADRWDSPSE